VMLRIAAIFSAAIRQHPAQTRAMRSARGN
jgi:hypothetical protein